VSPRHDIVIFSPISEPISEKKRRYRYNIGTYPFLAKPDITNIGPDIGFFPDIGTDIGSISGHTRSLPNPISGFSPISGPIWSRYCKKYRDIRISEPKKPDVIPDVFAISQYTDIVYFRHRAFSLISGTIGGPPGPPAAQARRPLSRRSNWSSLLVLSSADQRGSALGTAYMLAHSVLLQKLPWSRVVQHTPSHWQNLKLETGIIEFQVAPFVTVVADIRGARYLLRVWWA
jgi:hypothetical protein